MVDETNEMTGRAGESSQPQSAADEPHILEEHIVTPPQPAVSVQTSPLTQHAELDTTPSPVPTLSTPLTQNSSSPITTDISHILQGIKLPSRRESASAKNPDPLKPLYDTSLSVDPKSDAEKQAQGERVLSVARTMGDALSTAQSTKTSDDVRALHTLKDDLQNVVRDKKISLVRAVALEEEKRHHGTASAEMLEMQAQKEHRTRLWIFLASSLIILGLFAIGAVLYIMQQRNQSPGTPSTAQILFAEQSVPLSVYGLAPADVRRSIANARNSTELTLGGILQIIPLTEANNVEQPTTFTQFINTIGANAPLELTSALYDPFFFGLHTVDENAPVIVVPVRSFERAFAAMIVWEKSMNEDLSPMFSAVPALTIGSDGLPKERLFEDTVMNNYDVRVLKDEAGTIQLYYSFPTTNILIIAESPYSFVEILSRLRADRRL